MKLTLKRKKGFTLLEIIIVVIIIGVLASLALPRLFSTVEYSRSTEAFAAIGSIRGALERCSLKSATGSMLTCTLDNMDIANPANNAGSHFTYTLSGQGVGVYTIVAARNTLDGGVATSVITVIQTAGAITRTGGTAFSGVQ